MLVALDDVDMGQQPFPDSLTLFTYHMHASRAFILADQGGLARASLNRARAWLVGKAERELFHADRPLAGMGWG